MPHQIEPRLSGAHGNPQVIPILVNLLTFHAETGPGEEFLQIELDVLFLTGW